MIQLVTTVITGILLGSLYCLFGLGLALAWGIMDIVNLSHGAIITLGGYIAYTMFTNFQMLSMESMFICAAILFVFGFFMQKFLINPVLHSHSSTVVVTLGILMCLEAVMTYIWGGTSVQAYITSGLLSNYWPYSIVVGPLRVPTERVEVFIVSITLMFIIYFFLMKTDVGRVIRAMSQDREACALLGVNVKYMYVFSFAIVAAICGFAGAFFPMIRPIVPSSGSDILHKSFAIALLTITTGNILYSLYGGIALGIVENVFAFYVVSGYQDMVSSILLLVILLLGLYKPKKERLD